MNRDVTSAVWSQFGATIDSLEAAIRACPDPVWGTRIDYFEFWYIVYHTLFWLDYYMSDSPAGFQPPPPYNLDEMDPQGLLPERVYTQNELLAYLNHGRDKARKRLANLADPLAELPAEFKFAGFSVLELLLYSMRHVQHHAAQLNYILRQATDSAPRWVLKTKVALHES